MIIGRHHKRGGQAARDSHPPSTDSDWGLRRWVRARPRWLASRPRNRERWRYILTGERPEPIPSFRGTVEPPSPSRTGICCSGGGIRSAAFNLGALQVLQEEEVLADADYLAAVSGGSYIAAAFAMVGKAWTTDGRPPADPDHPENGHDDSNPALLAEQPPFARGSPEEQYLRNRSSYLAPDGTGKLFLAYRLVLGLAVNVIFLALPLFALTALAGIVIYRPELHHLLGNCNATFRQEGGCAVHLPLAWKLVPGGLAGLSLILGLGGLVLRIHSRTARSFLDVWATRLLIAAAAVAFFAIALPGIVDLLRGPVPATGTAATVSGDSTGNAGAAGGISIAALLSGVLLYLREMLSTPKKAAKELGRLGKAFGGLSSKVRLTIAYAAAFVIGPALFAGVIVFTLSYTLAHSPGGSVDYALLYAALGAFALFVFTCMRANLTTWSLHPFYKQRLCTAFALKRVRPSDLAEDPRADSRQEIEREERCGIAVERDFKTLVPLSETALPADAWPTLLVCAAANVSDPGATPPGRSVTSFTFSAESIGGPLIGAMPTADYENVFNEKAGATLRDFTLPAAVAMSGAALSPSMGKMTMRPLTFLMALANIRLGVWIPNPRRVAREDGERPKRFKRPRPINLFLELIGRNRVDAKYLYVTDGGHYENLGLVELLRRGCTTIYCIDASGGESFGELGDAIALARSELGVEIEIDPKPLEPDADNGDMAEANAVEGTFTYPDGEGCRGRGPTGRLIYARNVLTATAPWDVRAYHEREPAFPHNTTADQLYTDQKFEGYRALGEQAARCARKLVEAG